MDSYKNDIDKLVETLGFKGIKSVLSDYIYAKESVASGTPEERAKALMEFYFDDSISDIFDISGGDIANEILPHLDYDVIKKSNKRFFGYSDLTTVINAIYTMTGNLSVLYQVKNLVWDKTGVQKDIFYTDDMFKFDYEFIQGKSMCGAVVGGNIRCLLKLAGTKYFPDMKEKILFLESYGGMQPQISAYFAQLSQLGVFCDVSGVILGNFTDIEKNGAWEDVINIVGRYVGGVVPVAKTYQIGHQNTSKALVIGQELSIG